MGKHKNKNPHHGKGHHVDHRTHPAVGANMGEALASYYKKGHVTASGDRFNPQHFTGAHKKLEFGSIVQVAPHCEEGEKGKSLLIYINDDGPHSGKRTLDVTSGAAKQLCMKDDGTVRLTMKYLGNAEKNPALFDRWAHQPGQGFKHIPDDPDDLKPAHTPHHKSGGKHGHHH